MKLLFEILFWISLGAWCISLVYSETTLMWIAWVIMSFFNVVRICIDE